MSRLNWNKAKKYQSVNYNHETGKSLTYKQLEKFENRRVEALIFIQTYQGNSNFINSLKCKSFLTVRQIEVVEKISKQLIS
jgi:hypothetical protein